MKKKLRKELNKLMAGCKVADNHRASLSINNESKNKRTLEFYVEKIEKPEWIKVITEGLNTPFEKNKIFEVDRCDKKSYFVISNNSLKAILKKYTAIATPAEIEAHKLGFHVGDEVYVSSSKWIINHFGFCEKMFRRELRVYNHNGGWCLVKDLTKTPPKQFIIDIEDNWKLKEADRYNYSGDEPIFTTKQSALEYVLKEAKERFEGCSANLSTGDVFKIKEIFISEDECIEFVNSEKEEDWALWQPDMGWIAEPVKEPNLMLGNEVVEIVPINIAFGLTTYRLECKGESVTEDEWMEWYDDLNTFKNVDSLKYVNFYLGGYTTRLIKNYVIFEPGCPNSLKATIDQIEAITKALNDL